MTPDALQALVADLQAALADERSCKCAWRERALIGEARARALEEALSALLVGRP